MRTVTVKLPPPNVNEIRRYAACPTGSDAPLSECLSEVSGLTYRAAYTEFEIHRDGDVLDLGFAHTDSVSLRKALDGCDRILLFAATVGPYPDRMTAKYGRISPVKALFWQAIGTERVEALCDSFCRERKAEYGKLGLTLRPRFSPGYADLPLSLQKDIFAVLDCPRRLGLTLNGSLLMIPTKSVTAIAGITSVG